MLDFGISMEACEGGADNWIIEFALQLVLAMGAMAIGFVGDMFLGGFYYTSPFRQLALCSIIAAGIAGYCITQFRQRRAAVFVWVVGLALFLYAAVGLAAMWDATWASTPRVTYLWESLFGPDCGSQECMYTIPTDAFLGSVAYSVAARLALAKLSKMNEASGLP